jgi:hypothetical protein
VEGSNVTLVLQEQRPEHALRIDLPRSDIEAAVAGEFGDPVELLLDVEGRPTERWRAGASHHCGQLGHRRPRAAAEPAGRRRSSACGGR